MTFMTRLVVQAQRVHSPPRRQGETTVPVTIVVVDDDQGFRLIVRAIVNSEADALTVVGEAAEERKGSRSYSASAQTWQSLIWSCRA